MEKRCTEHLYYQCSVSRDLQRRPDLTKYLNKMPETRISYKRENKPNTLVFPSTSTTLSINPDAAFPRKLQRQSIQMDGTSVMPLFDSLELKQIKIQRLDFLGIFMLICTALGKLLQLNSNSFRAVRAIQVPTSNFHTPQSLSHKLSSTQCIIFS